MTANNREFFLDRLEVLKDTFQDNKILTKIDQAVDLIIESDIVLVGGNGGSASDSSHFTAELLGSFNNSLIPFPAINMTSDIAYVTAIANDVDYNDIFLQYIKAFSKFNVTYVFISTSGKSNNILKAINELRSNNYNANIILITGKSIIDVNDVLTINVNSDITEYIQEVYMIILHEIARRVKLRLIV